MRDGRALMTKGEHIRPLFKPEKPNVPPPLAPSIDCGYVAPKPLGPHHASTMRFDRGVPRWNISLEAIWLV